MVKMRSKAGRGIQLSFHQECFMIVFSCSSPVQITRHQVFLFGSEQWTILDHPGWPENKGRCSRLFDFCVQSVNTDGGEVSHQIMEIFLILLHFVDWSW